MCVLLLPNKCANIVISANVLPTHTTNTLVVHRRLVRLLIQNLPTYVQIDVSIYVLKKYIYFYLTQVAKIALSRSQKRTKLRFVNVLPNWHNFRRAHNTHISACMLYLSVPGCVRLRVRNDSGM